MNRLAMALLIILTTGCVSYGLIQDKPYTIDSITVTPTNEWNSVPGIAQIGGVPTWTLDGVSLNSISFFSDIEDGDQLIESNRDDPYPAYRADMLPTELVEVVESSVAKFFNGSILSAGELRPVKIGDDTGFEYTFEFVGADELIRKSYCVAVVKNDMLQLFLFQAARLHYFDDGLPTVKNLIYSSTIN